MVSPYSMVIRIFFRRLLQFACLGAALLYSFGGVAQSAVSWDAHFGIHRTARATPATHMGKHSFISHYRSWTYSFGIGYTRFFNPKWGFRIDGDFEMFPFFHAETYFSGALTGWEEGSPTGVQYRPFGGAKLGGISIALAGIRNLAGGVFVEGGLRLSHLPPSEGKLRFIRLGDTSNGNMNILLYNDEINNLGGIYGSVTPQLSAAVGREAIVFGKIPIQMKIQWNQSFAPMFRGVEDYRLLSEPSVYERRRYEKWHTNLMLGFAVVFKRKTK